MTNSQKKTSVFSKQQKWAPSQVKDLPKFSSELKIPFLQEGWSFAKPESRPILALQQLGLANLKARCQVLAASASELIIVCEDPYLLAHAIQNPRVKFSVLLFERQISGLKGEVSRIQIEEKICHIKLISPPQSYLKALGLHVLSQGQENNPKLILEKGALLPDLEQYFEYKILNNQHEFEDIINLRTRAYKKKGNYLKEQPLTDEFDSQSIIIIAKIFDRIIASLRIVPYKSEDNWYYDQYITWNEELPQKSECVEITRVCVDPDYWKTGVLIGLFQRTALLILQIGRRYFVGSAIKKLIPLYTKIGCIPTSLNFTNLELNSQFDIIFYADVRKQTLGIGISPLTWSMLWKEPNTLFLETNLINQLTFQEQITVKGLKLTAPLLESTGRFILRLSKSVQKRK